MSGGFTFTKKLKHPPRPAPPPCKTVGSRDSSLAGLERSRTPNPLGRERSSNLLHVFTQDPDVNVRSSRKSPNHENQPNASCGFVT